MIKRNIKIKVTPEESKQVQEICFANGIFFSVAHDKISYTEAEYLFIEHDKIWYRNYSDHNIGTETEGYTEVDADLFIKTKGTCIEETPEQALKQNTNNKNKEEAIETKPLEKPKQYLCYVSGKALPKHIHKTLEQAKVEAQRLCRKELAKVSVLEVVAEYKAEVLVKEV